MSTLPSWALLTRVWLEGWDTGNHGLMGWVNAVTLPWTGELSSAALLEGFERHPHTRWLLWHPPLVPMGGD